MARQDPALHLALDDKADRLLSQDALALLVGMLLDQQVPMERAFAGPATIAERLGTSDHLDARGIADHDAQDFARLMAGPPAVHRFPGSMAGRVQALARAVADQYDGDAAAVWTTASSGPELLRRLQALPGFGE